MKTFFGRPRLQGDLKRLLRQNVAEGKPLSILDDVVFKAMLASDTEDSREALRSLLSACTRREVAAVRILNNELIPAHLAAKSSRLDVHVTFNDGEIADLEMQVGKSNDNLKTRAAAHAAMLQSGQSKRGKLYKETRRAYQIFFLNCILFPQSDKIPRRYGYREETEHDLLTEVVEIIFYELPKLEQWVRDYLEGKVSAEALPEDEKWCIYMGYRHEERALPLIEELCREEEGIMRAEKEVVKISREERKFAREIAIIKNSMDRAQERYDARQEGLAEGSAQTTLEIARKMKSRGRPLAEISEDTGLSHEAIEQL